ncbi:HD domain-containing protein [Acinetobacter baumannii]|uniref:HD domain-containing protein n=1 Tax=Acinetobacter baumannii TaxID=470 RepID=A0AA90HX18_ACIBA|nr:MULTISPECIES: HD domain-containing protein [Acinetobacter calcoaceticus/baumannii complex]AYX85669.1 HD domain-containing protein [Acinetobacter baumannii]MBF6956712.1 HD domain-containing protein [Acinetobacter baumannii]MBV6769676.1 HD domain-containing protein [Acinetobacter baumannii]MDR9561008.1 HD domain-containing protein [Acinetobacter baumannii]MDR9610064.1 HD domain-containing protein [Acinetobacter baumannii]
MEFHDILHGHIQFADEDELTKLLFDLINSPEINRLRNMRQMNFDVPLIQELGRSRRLPHSVGVAHLAYRLSKKDFLNINDSKILLAAAIMHDAAIPPYGHLVESELKATASGFSHEKRVEELVRGEKNSQGNYIEIIPGKVPQVLEILNKHKIDINAVISVICPSNGMKTPISADIDLDNVDNVHRMAAMLGWDNAKENFRKIVNSITLDGLREMYFSENAYKYINQWLDFRSRIYTLIIAHPECIPYNALQADLVRLSVKNELITSQDWWLSEPEFEEKLRNSTQTENLAKQLISGCEYSLIDYVWIKNFHTKKKWHNADIVSELTLDNPPREGYGYFVWNEKGLISREIEIKGKLGERETLGYNSTSCMIAYVKKTQGIAKFTKSELKTWRQKTVDKFTQMFETSNFRVDFPENYSGTFLASNNNEFDFN